MVHGKMTIGFAGNENIVLRNISREESLNLMEEIRGGTKLVFLGDNMWVNPSQITYIEFKKN